MGIPRESASAQVGIKTVINTFDLATGELRAAYGFAGGGECNDIAIDKNGTVYASDFSGGRVLRLIRGDTVFRAWAASPQMVSADGIALLADGHVYVNTYRTGLLLRIPVFPGGKAGKVERIDTGATLLKPDGMRAAGPRTLLVAEGEGRLTELTVDGARAAMRIVKDAIADSPAGLTQIGETVFVLQARWAARDNPDAQLDGFQAIAIPYPAN